MVPGHFTGRFLERVICSCAEESQRRRRKTAFLSQLSHRFPLLEGPLGPVIKDNQLGTL